MNLLPWSDGRPSDRDARRGRYIEMLRKQSEQPLLRGRADPALCDQRSDEPRWGYVKGVIFGGGVLVDYAHGDPSPLIGPALDMRKFAEVAALDRDRRT